MPAPRADLGPIQSEFAGDAEMVELIDMFIAELGPRVEQIGSLLVARRLDELRVIAHQLKGAAGGYGYPALSDAASVLEERLLPAQRDLEAIRHAAGELRAICDRAIKGHRLQT